MKITKLLIGCLLFSFGLCTVIEARKPSAIIYHQRLIFLKMTANDSHELLFLLDTGASKSAVDIKTAEKINLPVSGKSEVEGTAGVIEVKNARFDSLSFGDAEELGMEVTSYDLSGVLAPPDMKVDGILGYDFLRHFSINISYKDQTIDFSQSPVKGNDCRSVLPFRLDNNIPRISGILSENIEADFRLDTGASLFETEDIYLNTTQNIWESLKVADPKLAPETYFSGSGVGGTVRLPVARINNFRIGDIENKNVYVIVQPKAGYFARDDAVGFISNNFLEKYDPVTIDYLSKRIFLTPR
ncbi:MAG: retropepsin-like aspartic protease [Pyrinomonadaceae bacterium]